MYYMKMKGDFIIIYLGKFSDYKQKEICVFISLSQNYPCDWTCQNLDFNFVDVVASTEEWVKLNLTDFKNYYYNKLSNTIPPVCLTRLKQLSNDYGDVFFGYEDSGYGYTCANVFKRFMENNGVDLIVL